MNLLSLPVLGGAAVLTAPALLSAIEGALSMETALVRYAVVAVLTWAALSALAMLVGPPPVADTGDANGARDDALDPTAVLPAVDDASGAA